ncbi:PTS mannose transporter subunit IIA [Niallia circulans]|uniref:PTS sugar transporter subunit IIA n=1 Tax=Niallia circulans TaxID=1397 RepID=UPI00148F89A2|nr:PTS mannose transporter subunit IIA [Niallia circulans]QJX64075.1 PTS mannose transporter subunit IIA [Niallia circulans]
MRIIIATHGELAKSLIETAELIIGTNHQMSCFCMTKSKSGEVGKQELTELIFSDTLTDLIIFTDVYGGSVNNICSEILLSLPENETFHLVSGVNLPMILTTIMTSYNEDSVEAILTESIKEGRHGIKYINELVKGVV